MPDVSADKTLKRQLSSAVAVARSAAATSNLPSSHFASFARTISQWKQYNNENLSFISTSQLLRDSDNMILRLKKDMVLW